MEIKMITRKNILYKIVLILLLSAGVSQVLAQYNVDIYNKSNRTVAVRINGVFQANLEPGASKSYYVNDKSTVNFSLSDTDPEVVQAIQNAAYQGINWKYDWTQYQMGSSYVEGPGTINLIPALHSDGTYTWVTLQVVPLQQNSTYYSSNDSYDSYDDDEDLVWYMILGLLVGAILPFLF